MRLHKEIDSLADKATITTEDDIHLILTFTNGTVVKITIPAIYPNVGELYGIDKQTFGMFKIDSVEGPQVPTLVVAPLEVSEMQDLKSKFFGDVTAIVDYVYNAIKEYCVCLAKMKHSNNDNGKKNLSQTGLNRRPCG